MIPGHLTFGSRRYIPAGESFPRARFVWDDENPDWRYKCRTQSPGWSSAKAPPAVIRYYPVMKEGAGDYRVNISAWWDFCVQLNGGDVRKVQYWGGVRAGQFNQQGWPQLMYVGMCGNQIRVLEETGDWVKFETLKVTDLARARGMTREKDPEFIHSFHCVTWRAGSTVHILSTNTRRGVVLYPLITELGYACIPKRHVVRI